MWEHASSQPVTVVSGVPSLSVGLVGLINKCPMAPGMY